MFNRQQALNTAYAKIVAQGQPAIDRGMCCYRSPLGYKCAVGWLIPDDRYTSKMEGKIPQSGNDVCEAISPGMMGDDIIFLQDLQRCHDRHSDPTGDQFVGRFQDEVNRLCEKYNLQSPV